MIYNVDMFGVFVTLSKFINLLIKSLKLGAGYTWPGNVVLLLNPSFLKSPKIRFTKGLILISGTNGKTTTSKLITHIFEKSSFEVVSNSSGANLKNGIASTILLSAGFKGLTSDFGVFEVDEFALPAVLEDFSPTALLLLNLSRDQLDRYGEIDTILSKWESSISKLNKSTTLIVDATQQEIIAACKGFSGSLFTFDSQETNVKNPQLRGFFNVKNVNAAVLACEASGISSEDALEGLETFVPAYGRGEKIKCQGKTFRVLLAKNPASFNYNLDAILSTELDPYELFFVLNDNIPDGRDVSWIYDIDPTRLKKICDGKNIYIAGSRSLDMALRLKHAGVVFAEDIVFQTIAEAFSAISRSDTAKVLVLPNYSAMLEVRKHLLGRKIL